MSSSYRYPGARPFERDESEVFFGRAKDIERLLRNLEMEQHLVLYAKSGLGKSSLLNAGLLPRIQLEQQLQPFSIRFQAYQEKGENVLPINRARHHLQFTSNLLDQIYHEEPKSL